MQILLLSLLLPLVFAIHTEDYIQKHGTKEPLIVSVEKGVDISYDCIDLDLTDLDNKLKFAKRGYASINNKKTKSGLSYMFYGAKSAKGDIKKMQKTPLIIWLQGGPGASSLIGNFQELGPFYILDNNGKPQYKKNQYSWVNEYNILFIDQPIGVGESYYESEDEIPINQDQVAEQFTNALQEMFADCLNDFLQNDLYIFGESYAGKYVPAIAEYILDNKIDVNLKGIGMGDGFTDPIAISQKYTQFGLDLGLIDLDEQEQLEPVKKKISQAADDEDWEQAFSLFNQLFNPIYEMSGLQDYYNFQNFDQRNTSEFQNFMSLAEYFKSEEGKKYFKPNSSINFQELSTTVYLKLQKDFMKRDCVKRLENVIAKKIDVLIYNGQNDLIVPVCGSTNWVDKLKFKGDKKFLDLRYTPWNVGKFERGNYTTVGYTKKSNNVRYVVLNRAGHMAPNNQPFTSYVMLYKFINNQEFTQN